MLKTYSFINLLYVEGVIWYRILILLSPSINANLCFSWCVHNTQTLYLFDKSRDFEIFMLTSLMQRSWYWSGVNKHVFYIFNNRGKQKILRFDIEDAMTRIIIFINNIQKIRSSSLNGLSYKDLEIFRAVVAHKINL